MKPITIMKGTLQNSLSSKIRLTVSRKCLLSTKDISVAWRKVGIYFKLEE